MIIDTLKQNWAAIENKRRFSLFVILVLTSFIVFLFLVFIILGRPLADPNSSGPDPKGPDEKYTDEQNKLEGEFQDEDQASSRVSQLISKLPYKGTNFSLSYDYGTFKFTLVLNQAKPSEGLSEYNQFLITSGIEPKLIEKNFKKETSSNF